MPIVNHHWRITRSELDQTWARHAIMDYLVMVMVAKGQYFFNLIASADSHPVIPWMTKALLGGNLGIHLQGYCEKYDWYLLGLLQLDFGLKPVMWSLEESGLGLIIWTESDTVGSEIVENVLMVCLSQLVKATQ